MAHPEPDYDAERQAAEARLQAHYLDQRDRVHAYTNDPVKDALLYLLSKRDRSFAQISTDAEIHIRRLRGELT